MSYPDLVSASPAEFHPVSEDVLADDPFTALNYHFGMLLGVDDFETEQAYHRGKVRLHQGWLHGPGVVWGLGLSLDQGEVRVEPGLALDGAGRELHLDAPACLDPAAWFVGHKSEVTLAEARPEGAELAFDAHVVVTFASCLTRPVPALAEPCEAARVETAYSRIWETIDIKLVPGLATPPIDRYRRVRVLIGVRAPVPADPADKQAADARAKVLATAPADRAAAALAAFRAMANADAAALLPPHADDGVRVLTPEDLATSVVLGDIRLLALKRNGDQLELAGGDVDYAPRRSHIQTATVQELTAALLAADVPAVPAPVPDGPQVTAVALNDATPGSGPEKLTQLVLTLSGALDSRSVRSEAFTVSTLSPDGWVDVDFNDPPDYDASATPPTVTLYLSAQPGMPWQVIARGSGTRPLIDAATARLGGGRDFVHIQHATTPEN